MQNKTENLCALYNTRSNTQANFHFSDNEIRQVFPVVKLRKKAASEKQQNQPPAKKDYGTIKVCEYSFLQLRH